MPMVLMAMGTVYSAYEGQKKDEEAAKRGAAADAQSAHEQEMSDRDRAWYDQNVRPLMEKQLKESQSAGLTAAGKQATDQYTRGLATEQRRIDAESGFDPSAGVTQGKQEVLDIEGKKGLASLGLQDASRKIQEGVTAAQLAGQGSQAAALSQQAAQDAERRQASEQDRLDREASSDWASVSSGIQNIAKQYGADAQKEDDTGKNIPWYQM